MEKQKQDLTYKWEYRAEKSKVVCYDNTFHAEGQVQAMCNDEETAKTFVAILNDNRRPETVL